MVIYSQFVTGTLALTIKAQQKQGLVKTFISSNSLECRVCDEQRRMSVS